MRSLQTGQLMLALDRPAPLTRTTVEPAGEARLLAFFALNSV